MKKIGLLFINLFLLILLSSCRNLINTNSPETDEKTIIVTGYIDYTDTPERSAVPTIPTEGISYNVYAKKANSNETSTGTVYGKQFSINVNKGKWTITVDGLHNNKVILSSSWTKTFKSDDDKITNYFTLHPLTTETGNIDLTIKIETTIKNFSKLIIESINPAWEKTEYTITSPLTTSNNSINIKKDSIPAGYYPLDFLFYDSNDSLVYTTTQLVNVYNNLTTSKWIKNTSDESIDSSGNSLSITNTMVNSVATNYYYVDGQNGDDSGNGNATLPFKTLSKAIEHVTSKKISDPTIYIAGTVAETNPITVPNRLTLRKTPGASTAKIVLEKDLEKSLFTQQSTLSFYIFNIEIDGNNHTVQGNGGCFNIQTGSAYLYGTTISNFTATGNGGGIYSTIKVTLDENTTVKNCEAKNGGGIYSSNKEINLTGSFINNKAEKGSGIYVDQAITFNNNLTIDTTNDIYLAKGTSIAVSNNSYPNIQKVIVTPAADFPSGATVLYANSTYTANSLKNKFVLAMPDIYEYVDSSSTSAYFKRKIYVSGADSTVLPEGSDENNGTKENPYATVSGARGACGGAFDEINIDGTVTEKRTILIEKDQHVTIQKYAEAQTALIVRDTEFNDSSMINSAGVLTLTNLTLDGNEVDTTVDGAGIKIGSGTSNNRSKLTLENTVIKNCYTNKNGGAIYNYDETYSTDLYLTDTEITNSKANDGAGIYTDKYLHISGSTLFNEDCNIYLAGSSNYIIIEEELTKNFFTLIKCSKYANNKTVLSGTEALLNSNHTKFELSKYEFYSLRTDGKIYNAIHVSDKGSDTTGDGKYRNHVKTIKKALEIAADSKAEIMLYNSLQLNEAANIVGDISFTTANSSECTITRGNFDTSLSMFTVQNAATLSLSNKITLDGTSVKLTTNGGAINCRSGGTVSNSAKEVKNFNVDSTGSYKGGAIYCGPDSTIGSSASYTNNSARLGGAMYIDDSANVSISGGTFTGNSAVTGSAIYDNGNVSVYGGTITTGQNFYLCTNKKIQTSKLTEDFTDDLIIQTPPTTNDGIQVLTGTTSNLSNSYQKFGIKAESYQLYKNGYACLYTLTASSEDTLKKIVQACQARGQTDFKINLDACTTWPVIESDEYLLIPKNFNVEITASAPKIFKPGDISGGLFKADDNATLKLTNIKIDASYTDGNFVIYMGSNNLDKPTGTIILGAGTEIYNCGSTRIMGTIYIASGTLITEPGCKITNNRRGVKIDDSAKFIYRGGDISGNIDFQVKVSSKAIFINESGSAGPKVETVN